MDRPRLRALLEGVATENVTVEAAVEALAREPFGHLPFATVDFHRAVRTGVPEVVYGEGKTPEQILAITAALLGRGLDALVTRIDAAKADHVLAGTSAPVHAWHPVARVLELRATPRPALVGNVVVVSAGTSDLPVAEEAAVVTEALGRRVSRVSDVGVAGIHRLFGRLDELRGANVVIVVAGMDGALPGVVAGLIDVPVIAVPTSVGYGAAFGGLAPLLTMLNACAAGVSVVNIDNGFGAAYQAAQIDRLATR